MTNMSASYPGPSGFFLLATSILDHLFCSLKMPGWRDHMPFGLGDQSKNGLLSHDALGWPTEDFPVLPTYQDFLAQDQSEHSLANLFTFAFKTPTTSLADLTSKDAIIALTLAVLIIRQIKAVLIPMFCRFGRNLGCSTHGPEWEKHNQERIMKFGEYVFRFMYHSTLSIVGIWYFWDKAWWDESKGGTNNIWLGHPHHEVEVGMIWYYLLQSAYNVDALISLAELSFIFKVQSPISAKTKQIQSPIKVSWNPLCRGDFREMALHHVITNLLVVGSSYLRFTRVGSMVFLIHDISDVPVDMSKLANFMKWKITTVVCFVTMLIVWVITRLGILPFVIMKSILNESPSLYNTAGDLNPLVYHMHLPIFMFLIGGIIALHAFWFFIIARIGWYLVSQGETHDLSEHKQGEDQGYSLDESKSSVKKTV